MTIKTILILSIFIITGCYMFTFNFYPPCFHSRTGHCVKIPVSFLSPNDPLVKVVIEEKTYTFLIDTGSSHILDLHKRVLDQIREKEFIKIDQYSDLQGTCYPVSNFRIPTVTLHHNLKLDGVNAYEEHIDFLTKGTNGGKPRSFSGKIKEQIRMFFIDGRLGWPAFEQTACLFDFHKNSLFLAKDAKTLQNEKLFNPEEFIQVPLEFSRCGPVLSIQTEWGIKKFLLDTGASYSAYKESAVQSSDQIRFTLNIKGSDFGQWDFWPYPITSDLLTELDGVLGIDFFKNHVICFDFQQRYIYIRKPKNEP
jgi:hypothetical protein